MHACVHAHACAHACESGTPMSYKNYNINYGMNAIYIRRPILPGLSSNTFALFTVMVMW